jgi:hypothetical protein
MLSNSNLSIIASTQRLPLSHYNILTTTALTDVATIRSYNKKIVIIAKGTTDDVIRNIPETVKKAVLKPGLTKSILSQLPKHLILEVESQQLAAAYTSKLSSARKILVEKTLNNSSSTTNNNNSVITNQDEVNHAVPTTNTTTIMNQLNNAEQTTQLSLTNNIKRKNYHDNKKEDGLHCTEISNKKHIIRHIQKPLTNEAKTDTSTFNNTDVNHVKNSQVIKNITHDETTISDYSTHDNQSSNNSSHDNSSQKEFLANLPDELTQNNNNSSSNHSNNIQVSLQAYQPQSTSAYLDSTSTTIANNNNNFQARNVFLTTKEYDALTVLGMNLLSSPTAPSNIPSTNMDNHSQSAYVPVNGFQNTAQPQYYYQPHFYQNVLPLMQPSMAQAPKHNAYHVPNFYQNHFFNHNQGNPPVPQNFIQTWLNNNPNPLSST